MSVRRPILAPPSTEIDAESPEEGWNSSAETDEERWLGHGRLWLRILVAALPLTAMVAVVAYLLTPAPPIDTAAWHRSRPRAEDRQEDVSAAFDHVLAPKGGGDAGDADASTDVAETLRADHGSSCQVFGCGGRYHRRRPCQCTEDCARFGNCCGDYATICGGGGGGAGSCATYGCGGPYRSSQSCQCTEDCARYGNCCEDFKSACNTPPSTQVPQGPQSQLEENEATPTIRTRAAPIKGVAYGPSPELQRGVLLPNDDFMSAQAGMLWASWGRADLQTLRALGANTVRLYGNDPSQVHSSFLDEAFRNGLGVIAGMSDWPYLQMPGSCRQTGYDCYSQIYESYKLNLENGFAIKDGGVVKYHPAMRMMIVMNEPEIGKFEKSRTVQCKVVASAFDAMLQAERDHGVTGKLIAFTVTYSFAGFYGTPGLGQFEMLYHCMKDPYGQGGYNPKNDLISAYAARWVNGFNTYNDASSITASLLNKYAGAPFWSGSVRIPVFVGEYHAPNQAQDSDLAAMLSRASGDRYPFFLGYCFFEFQARYDKAYNVEHEMSFGMFGLNAKCELGQMQFFGASYPVHPLVARKDARGTPMAVALAGAFGGESWKVNYNCREAAVPTMFAKMTEALQKRTAAAQPRAMTLQPGSSNFYRNLDMWGEPTLSKEETESDDIQATQPVPTLLSPSTRGVMKGVAYGPSPELTRGSLLPNDDFMSRQAAPLWAPWGRGDLATIRALGANTIRLYGNDPAQDHAPFLDEAQRVGLGVIVGISDWPYLQMPGNCRSTQNMCYSQIYESYTLGLKTGFAVLGPDGRKAYHPALRALIIINEPEIGKFDRSRRVQCSVVASAFDAILQAEKDMEVIGNPIAFTVTYSFASFYGAGGIGQMELLYNCMRDPVAQGGYQPKNDIQQAYLLRFANAFNTYSPASTIQGGFLKAYARGPFWKGSTRIPVFIGEYHAPSVSQEQDLQEMLHSASDEAFPFFLGYAFFEFQARYDKAANAEHEMMFGMFGLNRQCRLSMLDFFGKSYPLHSLEPRKDNRGVAMTSAMAHAYGGDATRVDYACKQVVLPPEFYQVEASPKHILDLNVNGSVSVYRDESAWDLQKEELTEGGDLEKEEGVALDGNAATAPAYRSLARRGVMKGVAYGPSPEMKRGVLLPNDDFMSNAAAPLWAPWGRGDLVTMRALGANTVRLYGNDPAQDHTAFLDEALHSGLDVIVGISDWPYLQMPGNCKATQNNCFSQVYESYKLNLQTGFAMKTSDGGVAYHPALKALIIINEPEIGKFDRARAVQCRVVASALDAILEAEREARVEGLAFTVTYSFASFYGPSGIGQMEMLYNCMHNPVLLGSYTPRNDIKHAYLTRFVNAFNTYSSAATIQNGFLEQYAKGPFWRDSVHIPVFIGEYHAPSEAQDQDLKKMLRSATDGKYPFFLGYSFFEFQARYDKAYNVEHEMSFGMFGVNRQCTLSTMTFFGKNYSVYALVPRKDRRGTAMTMAMAHAFSGDVASVDYSCKVVVVPGGFDPQPTQLSDVGDRIGSQTIYRNVSNWDLPTEVEEQKVQAPPATSVNDLPNLETPASRLKSQRGIIKGMAYGPSPEMKRGILLPNDDFMSKAAGVLWAPWGRGDLRTMRSLGVNTVRLYGNDPAQDHTPFLDEAQTNELGVIVGISDWPYLQMPGNCRVTQNNCYKQVYDSYSLNLQTGFVVEGSSASKSYHPALRALVIINEPEIGKFDKSRAVQCRVVASAMDAILQAEKDADVLGTLALSVTYSFASFYGLGGIGQMEMLYSCMYNPVVQGGYTPKNDILAAYLARFVNAFNTYSVAGTIQNGFLNAYARGPFWKGSTRIPVFIGEYHAPSASQDEDLRNMLSSTKDDRYPFFLGFSFFEFQARYDKAANAAHEMTFGMFGLEQTCTLATMPFFGKTYPVHQLVARTDNRGVRMAAALARTFGGDAASLDYSCKSVVVPESFNYQPETLIMPIAYSGSACTYRDAEAWDIPAVEVTAMDTMATPTYRSLSRRGVMRGVAYGPSPEMKRGVLLPNDDFMSKQAAVMWAPWGRGDLQTLKALGANTVRLYGNDPSQDHTAFLEEAQQNGLGVIVGISDWPFLQMPGNCQTTQNDCYKQIYESYQLNLDTGFLVDGGNGVKAYHPALRALIIINEPEIGKFDRSRHTQCRVVASAMDAILQAEHDQGVFGNLLTLTVTYSFASFYGAGGIGQMEMLYGCMQDPRAQGGYTPRNDLRAAYLTRFANAFNTYSSARAIQSGFLNAYARGPFWRGSTQIPVFIGEYHAPSQPQDEDLLQMLASTRDGQYPFFLGFCFFEFQARYDKAANAAHEMTFGMFGLDPHCTISTIDFFGKAFDVHRLEPRRDVRGKAMASALAYSFSGDASHIDYSCRSVRVPEGFDQHRALDVRLRNMSASSCLYRNDSAWDLPSVE